jgi:hypothetical protein
MRILPTDNVDLTYYSSSHLRSIGEALVERLKKGQVSLVGLDQAALAAAKSGMPTLRDVLRLKEACRLAGV